MSHFSKISIVSAVAFMLAGQALAQGTPPNAAVVNPAIGAGQQSSDGTSMGTTGVPTGSAPVRRPATSTMGLSTGTNAASSSSMGSGTVIAGSTGMGTGKSTRKTRAARADRN